MATHEVDGLRFTFPNSWSVSRYDDWSFYRNQFIRIKDGVKAIDLLAIDHLKTVWLIEVKDYTSYARTKPSDLSVEVSQKVFDTLAAMLPAKINANDDTERAIAMKVALATGIRVVLHLQQPSKHSKLFPRAINPADILQKLRAALKPVDAHPRVTEIGRMGNCNWIVERS